VLFVSYRRPEIKCVPPGTADMVFDLGGFCRNFGALFGTFGPRGCSAIFFAGAEDEASGAENFSAKESAPANNNNNDAASTSRLRAKKLSRRPVRPERGVLCGGMGAGQGSGISD
jgi:hypothetical protein